METAKARLIATYRGIIADYRRSPIYNSIGVAGRVYRRNTRRYEGFVKKLQDSEKSS